MVALDLTSDEMMRYTTYSVFISSAPTVYVHYIFNLLWYLVLHILFKNMSNPNLKVSEHMRCQSTIDTRYSNKVIRLPSGIIFRV